MVFGQSYSICSFEDIAQSHFHAKVFEVSKIAKSVLCDRAFVLIEHSETINIFSKIRLVLEIKICC